MSQSWWVVTEGEQPKAYRCPSLSAAVRFRQTIEELGERAAIDYRDDEWMKEFGQVELQTASG